MSPLCTLPVVLLLAAFQPGTTSVEQLLQQAENRIQSEDFAGAESLLLDALRLDAGHTQVLYRLGYAEYRQRKLETARKHFAEVVRIAPPAYFSRYFLGRIALLENKPREAVTWLEPILADGQAVFDAAAQLAAAYADSGMPAKAIEALQTAIGSAPWDAALYYRLGRLYAETGRKELSAEAFENSRRLRNTSREDVEVLMRVAQLAGSGKADEAVRAGAAIRQRAQPDPNALVALGVIYGRHGLQAEALPCFEHAASADSTFFQAHYNRGLALLKLNRAADGLPALARAVELLPQSIEANKAYALSLVINRRYQEAIAPLDRVWQADSSDTRIGSLLATALLRTGETERALKLLESESLRTANDPAPLLLLVEALNAAEKPERALAAAEDARKRFPNISQMHLAVAQQLVRLGRYKEAQSGFAAALRLSPGHPEAELGMGDTLARFGEHEAALSHYQAATKNERTSLAARTALGRSLIALRRFADARKALEESVAIHPSQPALHIELSRVYARLGEKELAAEQTRIVDQLRAAQEKQH